MTAHVEEPMGPVGISPTPNVGAGVGMPGWRFGLVIAILIALEFYSASLPNYASWHLFLLGGWLLAGLVWLLWLLMSVIASATRTVRALWRWGVIAALVTGTFIVADSGAPLRLRFELSRPAFERLAADLSIRGGPEKLADRSVGLYQAQDIERDDGGFRFIVPDTGCCIFGLFGGFVWTEAGEPVHIGDDHYEHLDGPWFVWLQNW